MTRLFLLLALGVVSASPTPLDSIDSQDLSMILTGFEVLADSRQLPGDPINVRVLRVIEDGHCSDTPETCPESRLYVAVSEHTEYPRRTIYRLPNRHNWEFVAWTHVPGSASSGESVFLELSYQVPSSAPDEGWWTRRAVLIKVNPAHGVLVDDTPAN